MNHKKINEIILMFDSNEIHQACDNLGFPVNWEVFNDELKTYTFTDSLDLLGELVEVIGNQDAEEE